MKLSITGIYDRGVPNKERLHFKVVEDTALSFFLVVLTSTASTPGTFLAEAARQTVVRAGRLEAYWFVGKYVKAGDAVVLFTGNGKEMESKAIGGGAIHAFYWGSDKTLFNVPAATAVLMELGSWVAASSSPSIDTWLRNPK